MKMICAFMLCLISSSSAFAYDLTSKDLANMIGEPKLSQCFQDLFTKASGFPLYVESATKNSFDNVDGTLTVVRTISYRIYDGRGEIGIGDLSLISKEILKTTDSAVLKPVSSSCEVAKALDLED